MEKEIFKVGDKVFSLHYGWGIVVNGIGDTEREVLVEFKSSVESFLVNGSEYKGEAPTLSFTEYTLQGFSQERPIELPEVGDLCLFRNFDCDDWVVRRFYLLSLDMPRKYITTANDTYRQMKRIKILD